MFDCRTVIVADHHKSVFVCRTLDTETGVSECVKLPTTRLEHDDLLAQRDVLTP